MHAFLIPHWVHGQKHWLLLAVHHTSTSAESCHDPKTHPQHGECMAAQGTLREGLSSVYHHMTCDHIVVLGGG